MRFFPLYIDPGTGSMLFSILIGAAATLYFLSRALIIKAKVFFSGGRAKAGSAAAVSPYVIYCEGAQYWNVFQPILAEMEHRQLETAYFTSVENDPAFQAGYQYIKPEYIGEGNKAFARLNLLRADIVLMTTPGLDVYQLKRSKGVKHYAHILHMASDATLYRLFGLDYFDSVLLTGDYQAADIRTLEKMRDIREKRLVTVGCTYLDVYAEKMQALPAETNHPFTVLVSPSWGPSALLSRYGERLLDPLAQTGFRIIVRPHPQSKKSERALLDRLTEKYQDQKNVEWDYERDNIFALAKADVMISDFSGIIFDYTFLRDKPVVYVNQNMDLRPYDADDICSDEAGNTDVQKLWQFAALSAFGIELREDMFDHIGDFLTKAQDNPALQAARQKAKNEAWMYRGEAARRVVDFMTACREGEAVGQG
ncbi:MAG: CDP-glycerol glycerophosphotransferase family protein [Spirochaetaceae bacterium]|nr:CDP-glycerol glycerophosphotransferase family protein [Spirochaetaceae bacterium]